MRSVNNPVIDQLFPYPWTYPPGAVEGPEVDRDGFETLAEAVSDGVPWPNSIVGAWL